MKKEREQFEVEVNAGEITLVHWRHKSELEDIFRDDEYYNCSVAYTFNPQDKKIRDALIMLGWRPPS